MDNDCLFADSERYGVELSGLFIDFCRWLLSESRLLGVKKVYFLMREGEFFYHISKKLSNRLGYHDIELSLLEVSRVSTFSSSVDLGASSPFSRLWDMYPDQSAKSFFGSLGISDCDFIRKRFSDTGYLFDDIIENISKNSSFQSFLCSPEVRSIIESHIGASRESLTAYLNKKNFFSDKDVAVVDIGWRGTMQDNLSALMQSHQTVHGFYLGLHSFKRSVPLNKYKYSFLFDGNSSRRFRPQVCLLRFVCPLEILCSSASSSVVGYSFSSSGDIVPVYREKAPIYSKLNSKLISAFQASVLRCIDLHDFKKNTNVIKHRKRLMDVIWDPRPFLVHVFRNEVFDNTYGSGLLLSVSNRTIRNCGWPTGFLYGLVPHFVLRCLPIPYLIYCLITFDSYLLRRR